MRNEEARIHTFTGKRFYPLAPDPKDVCIEDIAHALSNTCRYTGQAAFHYSVAQHSIYVSRMVPKPLRLCALLHDASEAYLVDVPCELKQTPAFECYRIYENRLQVAIAARYGLPWPLPVEVDAADKAIRKREIAWLFYSFSSAWRDYAIETRWEYERIESRRPEHVEEEFLDLFVSLRKEDA